MKSRTLKSYIFVLIFTIFLVSVNAEVDKFDPGKEMTWSECAASTNIEHIDTSQDNVCKCLGEYKFAYCETLLYTDSVCKSSNGKICDKKNGKTNPDGQCKICPIGTVCKGDSGFAYCDRIAEIDPDESGEEPEVAVEEDCNQFTKEFDNLDGCDSAPGCELKEKKCVPSDGSGGTTGSSGPYDSFDTKCLWEATLTSDGSAIDTTPQFPNTGGFPIAPLSPLTPVEPIPPIETPLPGEPEPIGCTTNEDCAADEKCKDGACVPDGDDEPKEYDQCPDDFDNYMGAIFKVLEGESFIIRDRQFRDSFGASEEKGKYPDAFEFSYDVELEILDSAYREEICWFFLRALEIYDGDEPEFYAMFSDIEEFIDLSQTCESSDDCEEDYYCGEEGICIEIPECTSDEDCVPATCCHADSCTHVDAAPDCSAVDCTQECVPDTLDCGQGNCLCQEGKCVTEFTGEDPREISVMLGFYPVLEEQFRQVDDLGAVTAGYYDEDNSEDLNLDDEGLELFIALDDTKFERHEEIDFDDIQFDDIIYDDSSVKGYLILDDPCNEDKWDISAKDLVELYNMFVISNEEIPVMINFRTLGCAEEFFDDTDEQFVDVVLFESDSPDNDVDQVKDILKMTSHYIKFIPMVNVMESGSKVMEPDEIKDLAMETLNKKYHGVIFYPYDELDKVINKIDYKNTFLEFFCEAEQYYLGEECEFEPIDVDEIRVAFIGNSGTEAYAQKVLELITEEDADVVVHLGNLGYKARPVEFEQMLKNNLSEDISFVAVIGQEEFLNESWGDYSVVLEPWTNELECKGIYGNKQTCVYDSVSFILSGVGTDFMTQGHEAFITDSLQEGNEWVICNWHKSNKDLRISAKDDNDDLGMKYYDLCKNAGAIIVSGYDEAYTRTKLLATLDPITTQDNLDLSKGTVSLISGLGGHGATQYDCTLHDTDNWWDAIYTSNAFITKDSNLKHCENDVVPSFVPGALFITFNYDDDPNIAKGEFITIKNEIIDTFEITK